MMATRQLMGATRSRALGSASLGLRRMATVSDSPLDKKVCKQPAETEAIAGFHIAYMGRLIPSGPPKQLGGGQLHQLQEDV